MLKCSAWNIGMFTDRENSMRELMFAQKVSNLKGSVIVKEHEEYLIVNSDRLKGKIQKIIDEDFEGIGSVQKTEKS